MFRNFGKDRRGTIAIWMGLSMAAILGAGALAVDMSSLYVTRAQLQNTAAAAALAAVQALPDQTAAAAAAQAYAEKNMPASQNGTVVDPADVVLGNWDSSARIFTPAGNPVNAVKVTARRSQSNSNPAQTYFASALGFASMDVDAAAVARKLRGRNCILALNGTDANTVFAEGNINVGAVGCDLWDNSCDSSAALKTQGGVNIVITNGEIKVCGGLTKQGPGNLSPNPDTHTGIQVADPFAGNTQPAASLYDDAGDCNHVNYTVSGSVDLYPGVYCGGITISGSGLATFHGTGGDLPNGLYIVKDGPLSISGTMAIAGNGATFFMTGAAANIDMAGTADVGLSAATSGGLAGFVFFGDRNNPAAENLAAGSSAIPVSHILRGTALGGYNGYIYLSGARIAMVGTADGTVASLDCTIVVADKFVWSGGATFESTSGCGDFGALPIDSFGLVN